MEDFLNGDLFIGYDHLYDAVKEWENSGSPEEQTMNVLLFLRAALQNLIEYEVQDLEFFGDAFEPEQIEKFLILNKMIQGVDL
jgi:hypothetical protein